MLILPISSQQRTVTPFLDCLFTAVSSTCVTGLVVQDTATYWSVFGQAVIILMIQIGDSTNKEFLETLGVDNYDVCIVTIKRDFQSSLETTALLDELGANQIVSRASSDFHAKFLLRNGADKVVFPKKQMAKWTAIHYTSNHMLDYVEIDENLAAFELYVPDHWVGKYLAQLDIRKNTT